MFGSFSLCLRVQKWRLIVIFVAVVLLKIMLHWGICHIVAGAIATKNILLNNLLISVK
jgi:hypothetical protein